jgi:hypothetical protein
VLRKKRKRKGRIFIEELHILCSSSNVLTPIKSRMIRLTGHVASVGDVYKILTGKHKGRYHMGDTV